MCMRVWQGVVVGVALLAGCKGNKVVVALPDIPARDLKPAQDAAVLVPVPGRYVGFDRNDYPGDDRLAELRRSFSFAGYWLTAPPGETANSWVGKREVLRAAGFGFLVLANGKLEKEIVAAGGSAAALGKADAARAVAAARREGFPKGTILFLDQEEGGRLTDAQAAYFFGWTEAVAATEYKAGAYVSGEPAPDGPGKTISTASAIAASRAGTDKSKRGFADLHDVALWVYEDSCPPAPGCLIAAAPALAASGFSDAVAWQYAQTPRRPASTKSCAKTYAADGMCYAGTTKDIFVDLNVAASDDPSRGR